MVMGSSRRPSPQTVAVLLALAGDRAAWSYGYDLCQRTGLKAGTMYPILMQLADRGYLETAWEQGAPPGRPPRHLYRLTDEGVRVAAECQAGQRRGPAPVGARLRPEEA
jgi:DNA-binding PadR family transcriptional regulator